MSLLKWSPEKPTQPGWYWLEERKGRLASARLKTEMTRKIVHVIYYGNQLYVMAHGPLDIVVGQWSGPIEPPGA